MEGLKIRWMTFADLGRIEAMSERGGIKVPLMKMAKKSDVICVVSELNGSTNGFVLYRLRSEKITIKNLVVDEEFRRMGIATALVARLFSKMSEKRSVIEARVSEYNLSAQLFLNSLSFKVEETVQKYDESEYVFRRHLS